MNTKSLTIFTLLLLAFLGVRFSLLDLNESEYINGQEISLTTTITGLPKISGGVQKLTVYDDTKTPIFVTTRPDFSLEYGKTIKITGTLTRKVLDDKRIVLSIYFPTIDHVQKEQDSPLLTLQKAAFWVRSQSLVVFQTALPSDLASLLSGIVFGSKEEFSAEFKSSLQNAGVMHVVAASGMNVALVGGFVSSLFMAVMRRQMALVATIVALLLYAVLAGLEASIVRATIMGILVFTSQIIGRQYLASFGLTLAGFFMLMVDPYLLWDVGFQLSFMATAGILFLPRVIPATEPGSPTRKNEMPDQVRHDTLKSEMIKTISADIKVTLSAQLATLPILVGTFGAFSPLSLLANVLVLWTTPILMVLGFIAVFSGLIIAPLGVLVSYVTLPFLWYFEIVVHTLGSYPVVEFSLSPLSIVGYYLILAALVVCCHSRALLRRS